MNLQLDQQLYDSWSSTSLGYGSIRSPKWNGQYDIQNDPLICGPRLECWPPLVMGSQLLAHCRMPVNPYIILIYRSIYIPGMTISELMELKFFMLKYSMLKYVKIYSNFWPPIHHLTEGQVSARQLASKALRYLGESWGEFSMSNSWTINWDPGPHPMLDHGLTLSSTRISNIYVGEYP